MHTIGTAIGDIDALQHELLFLDEKYRTLFQAMDEDFVRLLTNPVSPLEKFIVSHPDFRKTAEFFGNTWKAAVPLFQAMKSVTDEKFIKAFFVFVQERHEKFQFQGKTMDMTEIRANKLAELEKSCFKKMDTDAKIFLTDFARYRSVQNDIESKSKQKVTIEGQEISTERIRGYVQSAILGAIRDYEKSSKNSQSGIAEAIDDGLFDFVSSLGGGSSVLTNPVSERQKIVDGLKSKPEIRELADKYAFFKTIQKSAAKGYVLSRREIQLIGDIVRDLENGKVILLTGDTGSGKTELARFLCREYLGKIPVFASASKDMDVSDLTMEKVITSRSPLSGNGGDAIIVEQESDVSKLISKKAVSLVSQLNHKNEWKTAALEKCGTEESKAEVSEFFDGLEAGKSTLVTEYHLMAIYKAAELGRPVILDEVNLMRPEIFMALNDILTRRSGDSIQLPNALGTIMVKPGFCIIMTWNDPDQNSKKKRYSQGRYAFDEASYNRLRVYAKNYAVQKSGIFSENTAESDTEITDEQYLDDNELYGILLQMMLQKDGKLMRAGKYGFEVMKRDTEGKNIGREVLFASLRNLSLAISTIQNAYAGNRETLDDPMFKTLSLSTSIKRKVFSMRNLLEVYESYKTDVRPMEFHLYREFVQHATNETEQYALLAIFHEHGFFSGLVTDNVSASLENVRKLYKKLDSWSFSVADIENKIIVTRQDVAREYFGNFEIPDRVFNGMEMPEETPETVPEPENLLDVVNEVAVEDISMYCDTLKKKIDDCFDDFNTDDYTFLTSVLKVIHSAFVDGFANQPSKKVAHMAGLLIELINILGEDMDPETAKTEFALLMKRLEAEVMPG